MNRGVRAALSGVLLLAGGAMLPGESAPVGALLVATAAALVALPYWLARTA